MLLSLPTPRPQAQVSPETEGDLGVPQIVGTYHTLYPLEDVTAETTSQVRLGCTRAVRLRLSPGLCTAVMLAD